jgi:hypothetical protein
MGILRSVFSTDCDLRSRRQRGGAGERDHLHTSIALFHIVLHLAGQRRRELRLNDDAVPPVGAREDIPLFVDPGDQRRLALRQDEAAGDHRRAQFRLERREKPVPGGVSKRIFISSQQEELFSQAR